MKRLKFKKPFNGMDNAKKLIPESYKTDGNEFEMTDGNETYRVKWESSINEGTVLSSSNKSQINEDMSKMKHLMGFKSQDTLGTVKGGDRLDENNKFNDVLGKSKSLIKEMKGSWDDIVTNPNEKGEFDDYNTHGWSKHHPKVSSKGYDDPNFETGVYDDRDVEDIDPNLSFPGDLGLDEGNPPTDKSEEEQLKYWYDRLDELERDERKYMGHHGPDASMMKHYETIFANIKNLESSIKTKEYHDNLGEGDLGLDEFENKDVENYGKVINKAPGHDAALKKVNSKDEKIEAGVESVKMFAKGDPAIAKLIARQILKTTGEGDVESTESSDETSGMGSISETELSGYELKDAQDLENELHPEKEDKEELDPIDEIFDGYDNDADEDDSIINNKVETVD